MYIPAGCTFTYRAECSGEHGVTLFVSNINNPSYRPVNEGVSGSLTGTFTYINQYSGYLFAYAYSGNPEGSMIGTSRLEILSITNSAGVPYTLN